MRVTLRLAAALAALSVVVLACSKEQPPVTRAAPPSSASATAAGATRYAVESTGEVTFLIDAPLEKIKGRATKVRGYLDVDPANLAATRGSVEVDLDGLKTMTFDDAAKNQTQTEHAHNWLEIGSDVEAQRREENRWARFLIQSVAAPAGGTVAASAAPGDGERVVAVDASGDFWLHGVTSRKTVRIEVSFSGPANAPTSLRLRSARPLTVSLREHDVKPRDLAGKFLAGALEKVGQKIDDTVQVTLDVRASRP